MLLIVCNETKENIGTITEIVEIQQLDDPVHQRSLFRLKVEYTESNWRILRDAKSYFDNDVPEAPVTITDVKVDIYVPHIIVTGYQSYDDLIKVIPEPIFFTERDEY